MKKKLVWILKKIGLKNSIKSGLSRSYMIYFNYFTSRGKKYNRCFKDIPIIIISFNQLYYLKKQIEFLRSAGYNNLIIIDNNSTYIPLLDYFDSIADLVIIHRLTTNEGHLVFWKNKALFKKYSKGYYVISDADIVPNKNCPNDFLLHFKNILNKYPLVNKVGFSLNIDDIPETNELKESILKWEQKFWHKPLLDGNYDADIDTTFALYKPDNFLIRSHSFYKAIRTQKPYIAEHGGWYIDHKNLTSEQVFYQKTANQSASWLKGKNGVVQGKIYSKIYNSKKQHL